MNVFIHTWIDKKCLILQKKSSLQSIITFIVTLWEANLIGAIDPLSRVADPGGNALDVELTLKNRILRNNIHLNFFHSILLIVEKVNIFAFFLKIVFVNKY